MRLKIWRDEINQPWTIEIETERNLDQERLDQEVSDWDWEPQNADECYERNYRVCIKSRAVRPVLLVNQETRAGALKILKRVTLDGQKPVWNNSAYAFGDLNIEPDRHIPQPIHYNPQVDVIYFGFNTCFAATDGVLVEMHRLNQALPRIAFNVGFSRGTGCKCKVCWNYIQAFPTWGYGQDETLMLCGFNGELDESGARIPGVESSGCHGLKEIYLLVSWDGDERSFDWSIFDNEIANNYRKKLEELAGAGVQLNTGELVKWEGKNIPAFHFIADPTRGMADRDKSICWEEAKEIPLPKSDDESDFE